LRQAAPVDKPGISLRGFIRQKALVRAVACLALVIIGTWWLQFIAANHWPVLAGVDNFAYWDAWQGHGLYEPGARVAVATYVYSPAFAEVIWPLTLLPWGLFHALWIVGSVAAVTWMVWPMVGVGRWVAIVVFGLFAIEARADVFVALSIVLGIRYPAAWAFPLLTKVTPGIGVIWFALRGDWRSFVTALGVTLAIVAASFAIAPGLWADWIQVLAGSTPHAHGEFFGAPVPELWVRILLGVLLVVVGALRGSPWTLLGAAALMQPDIWPPTLVIFAGIPRLNRMVEAVADSRAGDGRTTPPRLARLAAPRNAPTES
jgi:hypothetical protein